MSPQAEINISWASFTLVQLSMGRKLRVYFLCEKITEVFWIWKKQRVKRRVGFRNFCRSAEYLSLVTKIWWPHWVETWRRLLRSFERLRNLGFEILKVNIYFVFYQRNPTNYNLNQNNLKISYLILKLSILFNSTPNLYRKEQ